MREETQFFFTNLIGTLAVILVISAFAGSTRLVYSHIGRRKSLKFSLIVGLFGGLFGVYGNISGFTFNGALISIRDIGPMISGFMGGPVGGLLSGIIAGVHRLTMGGKTAQACVVATCLIGTICGLLSMAIPKAIKKPYWSFLIGAAMEAHHQGIVLIMVKPFEEAWGIVSAIALPFILVNAIGLTLMIGITIYTEKQRDISQERSRLQSELEIANVIQHSLLPDLNESYPGRKEIDVRGSMEAAKEVGGDFYDAFFVDSNRIAFIIGDVSGKGIPAALFMASSKIILQNCIRDIPVLSEAIEAANNALCAKNEAEMFLTAWVGILDLQSCELTFVNAGHNPPVLIRENEADFLKMKTGFVLSGMENVRYRNQELKLQKGDTMFLYTDGVTEAENPADELFGNERLLDCLGKLNGSSPESIIETVRNSVDEFVDGADRFDDITMLCFRLN